MFVWQAQHNRSVLGIQPRPRLARSRRPEGQYYLHVFIAQAQKNVTVNLESQTHDQDLQGPRLQNRRVGCTYAAVDTAVNQSSAAGQRNWFVLKETKNPTRPNTCKVRRERSRVIKNSKWFDLTMRRGAFSGGPPG